MFVIVIDSLKRLSVLFLLDWQLERKEKDMLTEYDVDKLNPRKNPYAKELKKQVTIKIAPSIINYFKEEAQSTGIPYQTLINLYLTDCVRNKRKLNLRWE